jgi:hypothetical protein
MTGQTVTQLLADYQRLGPTLVGVPLRSALLVQLTYSASVIASPDQLEPFLNAEGWLLTSQRRTRLPAILPETEVILAGEAIANQVAMTLERRGSVLYLHRWQLDGGDRSFLATEFHCTSIVDDNHSLMNYLRLYNESGDLVAALFTGFEPNQARGGRR